MFVLQSRIVTGTLGLRLWRNLGGAVFHPRMLETCWEMVCPAGDSCDIPRATQKQAATNMVENTMTKQLLFGVGDEGTPCVCTQHGNTHHLPPPSSSFLLSPPREDAGSCPGGCVTGRKPSSASPFPNDLVLGSSAWREGAGWLRLWVPCSGWQVGGQEGCLGGNLESRAGGSTMG